MRKNRFTKPLLRRIEPLVRAGMMEEPKWYRAMKETPPYYRRPSNGLKELKLPWDRLANAFADRNPFLIEDPEWLGPNGLKPGEPPLRQRFAKRQYALIQKGIPEEEAYKRVEQAMERERAADVEAIRGMVQQASMSVGAKPSFVSDEGVYDGLRQWQAMMAETKYSEWDMAAKVGLDIFLRREVLKYDDERFKAAETARDGTLESLMAETARLRVALFPESKMDEYECPSNVVAPPPSAAAAAENTGAEQDQDQSGVKAEPVVDENRIAADEEWTTSMEEYKSLAAQHQFESDWDPETRRRLDAFVMRRCVKRAVLKEVFEWIPTPEAPEGNAGPTEKSIGGDGSQATASTEADLSTGSQGAESYVSRIPKDAVPDFLLGKDGRVDLDLDKQAKLDIDGDVLDEGGAEEDQGEADDDSDERWIMASEGELSETGFDVDWMAAANHRVGGQSEGFGPTPPTHRGSSAKEAPGSSRAKLRRNLELVLNQAKRQIFPELKLAVDEQGASPEEWLTKLQATKKSIMVDVKRDAEEVDKQRLALFEKLKRDFGEPEGLPWHYREQRIKPGVSKSERRRLRKKEKLAFKEYQVGVHERLSGKVPEERLKELEEEEAKAFERLLPTFKEAWEMDGPSGEKRSYPAKRSKPTLWRTPPLPNQQEHRRRKH